MTETTRWTDDVLEPMRAVGDPLADAVIDSLIGGGDVSLVSQTFRTLVSSDDPVPDDLPAAARDYFVETAGLPPWSDSDLIRQGEDVFDEFGLYIVTALFCASLPECYACAKGAHVLALTAQLETNTRRRIIETGQFLLDVMAPGGLASNGKGVRTCQKIRLMHAAVRHMCQTDRTWDRTWGVPINQEDLVGTLMAFSTVTLDAIEKLGLEVAPHQEAAYFHAWRNVGFVLGVRDDLLPEDADDGRALMTRIRERQNARSTAGVTLTSALTTLMSTVVPGVIYNPVPAHLIRFLVGNRVADFIQVPRLNPLELVTLRAAIALDRGLGRVWTRDREVDLFVELFTRRLLSGLIGFSRGDSRSTFAIPQELADHWRLQRA